MKIRLSIESNETVLSWVFYPFELRFEKTVSLTSGEIIEQDSGRITDIDALTTEIKMLIKMAFVSQKKP